MTVMTSYVLAALLAGSRSLVHVDTSDHRPVGNVGRLDARNVLLALLHSRQLFAASRRPGRQVMYLPIAQGELGFLRDALFFEVARRRRMPVVVHLHGAAFGDFYRRTNSLMRWLIRRCLGRAERAIVLSDSLKRVFDGLVPEDRVFIVPNGIPSPFTPARVRTSAGRKAVLFLSNLSEGKGHLDLIEAASIVLSRRSDVDFTIAGEWPSQRERQRSQSKTQSLGIDDQVRFVPSPSGLRKTQLFQSADVFVFPPRQLEGQPVVLLEAMSHGIPVIATPRGGIVDIVHDNRNGLLVPPGDPEALAHALNRLLDADALRLRLGQEGRRMYEAKHTIPVMRGFLDEAFDSMVVPPLAWRTP